MLTPRRSLLLLALLTLITASGCSATAGVPRLRVGSLPFPGIFSLYEAADAGDLGVHCSGEPLARIGLAREREHGTLYTRRAGFIDLSHVRESIDWVTFFHTRICSALHEAEAAEFASSSFSLEFCEGHFEITVSRPDSWKTLPPESRSLLADELAIRAAQRLAIIATTWHEIATWYGHQTLPVIPEHGSAFTWDDSTAHVVGALVGGKVLRARESDWDRAVTVALDTELSILAVVSKADHDRAAEMVRDRWWKGWVAIRRDLDVGLSTSFKVPWLVAEFGTDAAMLELPTLADVFGYDLRAVITLSIMPSERIMRKLSSQQSVPHPIEGEQGLLDAVERVRASMREEFG